MSSKHILKRGRESSSSVNSGDERGKKCCFNNDVKERIFLTSFSRSNILATPKRAREHLPHRTPQKKNLLNRNDNAENKDRFVPIRSWVDPSMCRYLIEIPEEDDISPNQTQQISGKSTKKPLRDILLTNNKPVKRVLNFSENTPTYLKNQSLSLHNSSNLVPVYEGTYYTGDSKRRKAKRFISGESVRTLDAPDLVDDFYLNLLSWGRNNVIAVALEHSIYLWNAGTGDISHLGPLGGEEGLVTSVQWMDKANQNTYLAVGTDSGVVQLWDTSVNCRLRSFSGHVARASSLSWKTRDVISSGSQDSTIRNNDIRVRSSLVDIYVGHTLEVCGLKWHDEGRMLASGGNDNNLCLWDSAISGQGFDSLHSSHISPRLVLKEHSAAVKAIAWSPHERNLLATGGGSKDRCIKTWNAVNGTRLKSVETNSQVCSLLWSTRTRELVSSHGFSQHQLCVWSYPSMDPLKELLGHTSRALFTALSPDGGTIVSGAADETLRFWDTFERVNVKKSNVSPFSGVGISSMNMR